MIPSIFTAIYLFLFGLCVGSFVNVCICRLPSGESIVFPASHCTSCGSEIKFYDNIPLLSFLFLKGRCRSCGERISFQYPLVELLTGALFILFYYFKGLSLELAVSLFLASGLLVVCGTDIRERIIPDEISLYFIPVGVILSFFTKTGFWDSLAGIFLGGGVLFAIGWSYEKITGVEGMGGGDVKLLAMIGAFTGVKGVVVTLLAGSVLGSVFGALAILLSGKGRRYPIPFGIFLSMGAILYILAGDGIVGFYLKLLKGVSY